jgi:hypothetical protein
MASIEVESEVQGTVWNGIQVEVAAERISRIYVMRNPDKLARLALGVLAWTCSPGHHGGCGSVLT